jgi:hypothetical protein
MKSAAVKNYSLARVMCILAATAIFVLLFCHYAFAIGQPQYVRNMAIAGGFPIVQGGRAATILVTPEDLQPDYNQVGPDRVALNQDCACYASMARRRRSGVAEIRR